MALAIDTEKPEVAVSEETIDSLEMSIDLVEEKKLLRKLDWHILPILWILYLCAFIDR